MPRFYNKNMRLSWIKTAKKKQKTKQEISVYEC